MTPRKRTRVALYHREAVKKQNSKEHEKELVEFSKQNDWEVVAVYSDIGSSGRDSSRPRYQQMLTAGINGTFQAIVVRSLDRLSRDPVELSRTIRNMKSAGVHIVATQNLTP